jgi:predicted nucleic acid-binding protein
VDTNVLIAAVVSRGGTCAELLTAALAGRWTPIVSPILLEELADVFGRPKFRRSISSEQVEAFTADLALVTELGLTRSIYRERLKTQMTTFLSPWRSLLVPPALSPATPT